MLAAIIILNLIFFGLQVTYLFRLKLFLEERIIFGLLIGLVTLGYLMLILSHLLGLNIYSLFIFLLSINTVIAIFINKDVLFFIKQDILDFRLRFRILSWKLFFLILLILNIFFGFLASQLFILRDSRYFVQPVHAYGDISLHLGIITSFAYADNFPPQNPIFSEVPISYPFLFDFITSIFINPINLSISNAIAITGILGITLVIFSLAYFALHLTKNKLASLIFLILFFFNGGLGFIYMMNDFLVSNLSPIEFINNLQRDYTALKEIGFYWINVVLMMLLPQRSFLLGFPIALLILRIFWELTDAYNFRKFILATLLISLLPIIHAHSLLAIAPFLFWLGILILHKNRKKIFEILMICIVGILVLMLLSNLFLQQSQNFLTFLKLQIGWMSDKENMLLFYIKNFGLTPFLIIPSILFILKKKNTKLAYLIIIAQVWFILPSIFLFQPWDFDNTKLFIYWHIVSALAVAYLLSSFIISKRFYLELISILAIFLTTFSGALDIYRLFTSSGTRYEVYSPQAIRMGEFVKDNTAADSIFLAIDKFDNPAISLAGRKTLVGFHGWLWTYGLDYSQREVDVRKMLIGEADKSIFDKYRVSHVVFFSEPTQYQINKEYFHQNFRLIYNQDGYEIFKL